MQKILLRLSLFLILSALLPNLLSAQTSFVAFLSTTEENLSTQASSVGYAIATLSQDRSHLDYQVVVWSISDIKGAHFHIGSRGEEGDTTKSITFSQNRVSVGSWTSTDASLPLTSKVIDALFAGRVYVNVHTLNNPGGETRGQLFRPETYFAGASGQQETPAVNTSGRGAGFFIYNPTDTTVYFRGAAMGMSSTITAAHIHQAAPGSPGSVIKPTPMEVSATDTLNGRTSGYWTPTDSNNKISYANVQALRNSELYWNVHTRNYPAGEIRGQITKGFTTPTDTGMFFMAMLSGPQEGTAPNPSNGIGTAFGMLSPDGRTFRMIVLYNDLTGPVLDGHIHHGEAGVILDNNVVKPIPQSLALEWTANDASRPLSPADVDSLFAGKYYVNLHTQEFLEGEIRGQLMPLSQRALSTNAVRTAVPNAGIELYQNYPNPFNPSTSVRYYVPSRMSVRVDVRNAMGELVEMLFDGVSPAGDNTLTFDASALASGVYYVTLTAASEQKRVAVVLSK